MRTIFAMVGAAMMMLTGCSPEGINAGVNLATALVPVFVQPSQGAAGPAVSPAMTAQSVRVTCDAAIDNYRTFEAVVATGAIESANTINKVRRAYAEIYPLCGTASARAEITPQEFAVVVAQAYVIGRTLARAQKTSGG